MGKKKEKEKDGMKERKNNKEKSKTFEQQVL